MAILPLAEKYRFQTFNYDWVKYGKKNYLTKVNGIFGTLRKMLYFDFKIIIIAKASTRKSIKLSRYLEDYNNLLNKIARSL
jgi:hypothetical protein